MYKQFTSESVAAGHPDKICDQISDAIVDAALKRDPKSRVAVETMVTRNRVVMAGEVTSKARLNYRRIARGVIKDLGYTRKAFGFSTSSPVSVYIHEQSPDISSGVEDGGAGDQGMMFGYATDETREYMPLPISLAHAFVKALDQARISKKLSYLRPDGKAEVVVDYKKGKPCCVSAVIIAVPHDPQITNKELTADIDKKVVRPVLDDFSYSLLPTPYSLIVNGTGRWEIGGPASDTGVTGRKIIVDTYGGMGRHGGGCFSGKDPTKVDRSGAYACRFLAKNIVAAKLARRCEVKVAYVIGRAEPVSIAFNTFATQKKTDSVIRDFAREILELNVPTILEKLDLRRPIYRRTASYGHFGNPAYPWERIVS